LGATPLSQAGRQAEAEEHTTPRESGVADAGLRQVSLPLQSKTLSHCLSTLTKKYAHNQVPFGRVTIFHAVCPVA
jgi:hypothetical protein